MNARKTRKHWIEEFEQAWQAGQRPHIAEFVRHLQVREPDAYSSPGDSVIHELIAVDLEWRWKNSALPKPSDWKLEEYWRVLPGLGAFENVPLWLVEEEYRVRRLWGDRPALREYVLRFPQQVIRLEERFAYVDREILAEKDDRTSMAPPAQSMSEQTGAAELTLALSKVGDAWARFEDYLLHEMIGAGQMGRVYRATHLPTGEATAVKFLRKSFHRNPAATARFLGEAQIVSSLSHPGLALLRAVGKTPGGGYFFDVELLEGPNLASVMARGKVSVADAIRWISQAAETIAYAHDVGVIHCDLKPGNLVLDKDGNVRVTDFGLARRIGEGEISAKDGIAGTAPFMAPEQVNPWWGAMGPATDVYALGAVLYSLLTGRPPFTGVTVADVLVQVASGVEPDSINVLRLDTPRGLTAVVSRAMAKEQSRRYQSARDLKDALNAYQANLDNDSTAR